MPDSSWRKGGTKTAGTRGRSWRTWRRSSGPTLKLIDLAAANRRRRNCAPAAAEHDAAGGRWHAAILNYNERQVAKRIHTVDQLLAEFEENRANTIAAVEATDEELFDVVVTSAGGVTGPLSTVMNFVAVEHMKMHVRDIAGS
jgi:hypothetical protein